MSYLFQVHGLFDDSDDIHLDYSWTARDTVNEAGLTDSQLLPFPALPMPKYQPAWFAPFTSALAVSLAVPEAKRYCSGAPFTVNPHMARVHAEASSDAVDWNGNGVAGCRTRSRRTSTSITTTRRAICSAG